jgi:tetratricopeptide (TPR) repeat protein
VQNVSGDSSAAHQALDIFRRDGDKEMESRVWDTLGLLAEARRNQEQAIEYYRRAVEINTEIGNSTFFAKRARKNLERSTRGSRGAH